MKSEEQIAKEVLDLFAKANLKPGHVLGPRTLPNYVQSLNPKERSLLDSSIQGFIAEDLLTVKAVRGLQELTLTQLGFQHLYPVDREQVFREIKETVLSQFRDAKANTGFFIPNRSLQVPILNPREQELLQAGLQNIKDEGYITFKDGGLPGISLTEAGFDYIYQ